MTSSAARKKVGIFSNIWIFRNRSSNTDDQSFFVMRDAAAVRRRGRRGGAPGEWRSVDGRGKPVRRRGDGWSFCITLETATLCPNQPIKCDKLWSVISLYIHIGG